MQVLDRAYVCRGNTREYACPRSQAVYVRGVLAHVYPCVAWVYACRVQQRDLVRARASIRGPVGERCLEVSRRNGFPGSFGRRNGKQDEGIGLDELLPSLGHRFIPVDCVLARSSATFLYFPPPRRALETPLDPPRILLLTLLAPSFLPSFLPAFHCSRTLLLLVLLLLLLPCFVLSHVTHRAATSCVLPPNEPERVTISRAPSIHLAVREFPSISEHIRCSLLLVSLA